MARHTDNADKSNEVDSTTDKVQRRRIMKHMVEKRRRNRINDCLENMRILVLKAQNKNPENYTKMEKADILEMTTNFLFVLNQQKTACATVTNKQPTTNHHHSTASHTLPRIPAATSSRGEGHPSAAMMGEYLRGFSTCQADVTNYIQRHCHHSTPTTTKTTRGFPAMVSPPSMTSPPTPHSSFMRSPPPCSGNLNLMNSAFRKPEATSTCTKVFDKDVNSNQRDFCVSTTSHDHVVNVNKRKKSDSDIQLFLDSFDTSVDSSVCNTSHDFSHNLGRSDSKDISSCSKDGESMDVSQSNVAASSSSNSNTFNNSMWRPW